MLIALAVSPSTASVGAAPDVACGTNVIIAPLIAAAVANVALVVSVNAVAVPAVVNVPEMSSRHLATEAISARAESFTLDGAWPSAQFTVGSAVALLAAVLLQVITPAVAMDGPLR
jgi:hypothetical protein